MVRVNNQKQRVMLRHNNSNWFCECRFMVCALIFLSTLTGSSLFAQGTKAPVKSSWAEWIEPDFPFFSSVVDGRHAGAGFPTNNLTPRGLVINLGQGVSACFDTDLLRVSAVWMGKGVTPEAIAPLSYHDAGSKTQEGQTKLPVPDGRVWLANGIYPGWQLGEHPVLTDPREPAPSLEEVGRGPVSADVARFQAIRLTRGGLVLEYSVVSANVREWMSARELDGVKVMERRFHFEATTRPVLLVLAQKNGDAGAKLACAVVNQGKTSSAKLMDDPNLWVVQIAAHAQAIDFCAVMSEGKVVAKPELKPISPATMQPALARWPQTVTTKAVLSASKDAYVVDEIALPLENPWRRNIRLADIQFFRDGTAAAVTIDGDVWLIRGLNGQLDAVQWKRFASGLHEPMSLAIRDEQIYVYDRNGIWRLRDTNGDGEADVHELFSNAFAQTAETRDFPSSMKLAPDGSFVISKGGQQGTTIGKHNGTVLRISADGRYVTMLGWGFRQPFVGVHPRTGLVTASDQEGNYVPTTPLYIVDGGTYHGFLSELLPKEKYPAPIADPLTWVPHAVNASGLTQTWLMGARMGPLNDALVHVGYNRPELFRVMFNNRQTKPQAAVVSLTQNLDFAPFNCSVSPADGQLYVAGFQIFGTTAKNISGLARLRYTGAPSPFPKEIVPMDKGILLRFDVALNPAKATDLANYSVERWNYKRTYKYGSPHFKLDGKTGQEWMPPSSVYLSKDSKSVFIGMPDMKPVMQMRVGWSLASREGVEVRNNGYFTPFELTPFSPIAEGFENITVDLTPKAAAAQVTVAASAEEGRRLYELMGCMACHSTDGTTVGRIGPSWKGLFGKKRDFAKGPSVIADEAYIKESVLEPSAKVVKGFEKSDSGMPTYAGVITDSQIDSIILFIKTLKEEVR